MTQWIETKISYDKVMENGLMKKVTEPYLVDALSFAEAEARIIDEMRHFISGDFTVEAVKKQNIDEVMPSDNGGFWYKLRAMFLSINERTGTEKLKPHNFLVQADNVEEAISNFKRNMNLMVDCTIVGIKEAPIMDIFTADMSSDK